MGEYVHRIDAGERARIRRFLVVAAVCTVGFVVLIGAGLITAHRWVQLIGHESERRFAEPHIAWIREHLLDTADPGLQAYIDEVGAAIVRAMDVPDGLQLQFHVIDGDSANAFTTLGGHIFVVDELMVPLDNENALAFVLAHEVAHAINRDPLTSAGRGILLQLLLATLSGSGMDPSTSATFGAEMALNVYSRRQEEAADALAAEAVWRHYGHIGGATQLFAALLDTDAGEQLPEFLLSHPHLSERIAAIQARAARNQWRSGGPAPFPAEVRAVLSSTP